MIRSFMYWLLTSNVPSQMKRTVNRIMVRKKLNLFRLVTLAAMTGFGCLFSSFAEKAVAADSGYCLECHGEKDLTATRQGLEVSLFIDHAQYASSVHGANGIGCDECHADVTASHPDEQAELQKVDCGACHDESLALFSSGVHGALTASGQPRASCKDCHGSHDILPSKDTGSRTYPLHIPTTCGTCHNNPELVGTAKAVAPLYQEGQHGISTKKGMLGAAVCTDCHGSHAILPKEHPDSLANPKNASSVCGSCHQGSLQILSESIHGREWAGGNQGAPTCTNCHTPHNTMRVDRESFLLSSIATCGGCHHKALKTYQASYHGQITDLGFTRMAKCYNCHGSHDILPASDPASRISEARRLETCRQCHPAAEQNFIGFAPHLDHSDKTKFPVETAIFSVMTALLLNVFIFFNIHTLLWFIRSMFAKLKKEDPPHLGNPSGRYFIRINYYHRITHFLIFTSFVVLSLTGLPLKFHDAAWAKLIANLLGGYEVCGVLHRMMGLVTFGYFGLHLAYVAYLFLSGKMKFLDIIWGPRSIVPQPNDAVDIVNNFKWFFGMGPKPKFGRFTYWEKFDYLAVFWGVAIIGVSGLVLWFPEQFTKFLPGIVINIAWIIHADEALLATGFIFLIHFYNTHLRVEKFPLDPVILTGRIDEEEMRHERPLEFALRREDGSLREIETTPPPRWMTNFSKAVGWTFVFIGFTLLIFMVSSFFV